MRKQNLLISSFLLCLILAAIPEVPAGHAGVESASNLVVTFETGKQPTGEIHVATTGSDTTGSGSPGNPYATVGRAVQDAVPGSAIRIHAGTYACELLCSGAGDGKVQVAARRLIR